VFFRTLLRSSAIFIGASAVMLHPSLEWRTASAHDAIVGAQQSANEAAVDGLIAAIKDSDAGVRRQVVRALAELGSQRAVPALIDALKDADVDVRVGAIRALGDIRDARAIEPVTQALKDGNVNVRRAAAMALAELSGTDGHMHPHPHPHPHPVVMVTRGGDAQ
jgi:HEAT repeat protein